MISINPSIFIVQIITFLIALFIVWKIAWKPLVEMLIKRRQKIQDDIDMAEKSREEAEAMFEVYENKLKELEIQKRNILEKTKEEALLLKNEISKETQKEINDMRAKVLIELKNEKDAMLKGIRNEIITASMEISGKVLEKNITDVVHKDKFEKMLDFLNKEAKNC